MKNMVLKAAIIIKCLIAIGSVVALGLEGFIASETHKIEGDTNSLITIEKQIADGIEEIRKFTERQPKPGP
jgi:hypothetical protein